MTLYRVKFCCGCNSRCIEQYIRFISHQDLDRTCHSLITNIMKNNSAFSYWQWKELLTTTVVIVKEKGIRINSPLKTILENDWRCYRCRLGGLRSRQPMKFLVQRKAVENCIFDPSGRPLAYNMILLCHSCIHIRVYAAC